jgi:type IV secretion system protein TrbE
VLEDGEVRTTSFEQVLGELERSLSSVFPGVRRMRMGHDHDELYAAVHYALNGELKRCRPSAYPVHLDTSLARQLTWSASQCVYDEDAIAVVGLTNLPLKSTPAVLANLGVLGIEYRFTTRFIPFDYLEARGRMGRIEARWGQAGSVVQLNEVAEARQELEQGHVRYGHYSAVVVLRERIADVEDAGARRTAHDVVNERARVVAKALQESGFEAIIERSNKLEAFLASLPGHGVEHVRKPLVNTVNVADMVPLAREWNGSRESPCAFYPPNSPALLQARTWSGAPFYFNLHQGDVGHTAIFGPTGKGKSTLLGLICSQFSRYANSQVFVLDFGYSMYALTAAQPEGVHYALGGGDAPELCPLAQLGTHDERAWAADWIASLCEEQRVDLTPELRQVIYGAVEELAASTVEAAHRTLRDYRVHLQHPRLNAVLDYYISGPGGRVLNGQSDALRYARFTTFETERLFAFGAAVATPTLSYVFRQIERRLDGRPTLLVIDEAWLALRRYGEKLREWLKTLRKKNCAVVLATQSLSDVVSSPLADVVFESCPTKVLLPNEQAPAQEELYVKRLMLNAAQVEALARVEGKRWYMQLAEGRSRMFSLDLGPVALSFVGAGGKADLARIRELQKRFGTRWAAEWLAERGLVDAAVRLRELEARARSARGER